MDDGEAAPAGSQGGAGPVDAGADQLAEVDRRATGLAVAAAGLSIFGAVSLFRLRVGWDQSRGRALRRFLGVQAESLGGVALGYHALNRLRSSSGDRRGVPFAVVGIVLGAANVARAIFWLRQDRPEL
jgi:hypothetical protein